MSLEQGCQCISKNGKENLQLNTAEYMNAERSCMDEPDGGVGEPPTDNTGQGEWMN